MTERKQRPALRAVSDGDDAGPAKKAAARKAPAKRSPRKVMPVSVTAAARSGDRRQLLVALQARVARALDDPATTGPAFAALIKQSRELAEAIAESGHMLRGTRRVTGCMRSRTRRRQNRGTSR